MYVNDVIVYTQVLVVILFLEGKLRKKLKKVVLWLLIYLDDISYFKMSLNKRQGY